MKQVMIMKIKVKIISNFVDRVLKKVSEEIVNDDDSENGDDKKLLKMSKENVDLKSKVDVLEKN